MTVAPIRWTLGLAATEFGLDRRTLSTRAKTSGQVPGDDGKFSTRQINAIINGDTAGEKLRKLRAEADLAELERDGLTKRLVPIDEVDHLGCHLIKGIMAVIGRSQLPADERDDIQDEVRAMLHDMTQRDWDVPQCKEAGSTQAVKK